MGEIADMILEGLLDEETGEYIGDQNLSRFGEEAPGFPVSYEREARESGRGSPGETKAERRARRAEVMRGATIQCPLCQRTIKVVGFEEHYRVKHLEE